MQSTCSRASSRLGFPYAALTGLTPVERIEVVRAYLDAALTRAADIHASRDHHHEGGGRMSATTPTTHPGHTQPTIPATEAAALAAPATPSGGVSPFDRLRRVRPDGVEVWSARDLMPVMGYSKWEHFEVPIRRAMKSAENQGLSLADNFPGSRKDAGTRGPAPKDVELSRFACYLVAMNGDPNKAEVAAAQAYFAVRTRQAEVGGVVVPRSLPEALRAYAAEVEAHGRSRAELEVARPKVEAFESLVSASGDWSVAQAAKVLARDHGIVTGPTRLWRFLEEARWVFRSGSGALVAMQAQVDAGRLTSRAQSHVNPASGRRVVDAPQVRVTPKGVEALRLLLLGARAEQGVGV